MCFWCDLAVVSAAQQSPAGIRRIAKDLKRFSVTRVDVFQSAAAKLTEAFLHDLRVVSVDAEQQAMFKEDRVEQCHRGRYYIEYDDPDFFHYNGKLYEHPPWLKNGRRSENRRARMWISEKTASHMCLQRKLADNADWGKCEITLPFVSLDQLISKYYQEKPNQPRCSHCGALYLWRLQIKSWELACWQVSAPEYATVLPCMGRPVSITITVNGSMRSISWTLGPRGQEGTRLVSLGIISTTSLSHVRCALWYHATLALPCTSGATSSAESLVLAEVE